MVAIIITIITVGGFLVSVLSVCYTAKQLKTMDYTYQGMKDKREEDYRKALDEALLKQQKEEKIPSFEDVLNEVTAAFMEDDR